MSARSDFFHGDDLQPPGAPDPDDSFGSASRSTAPRPSLRLLVRGGLRAVRRYPGLVAALYLVQLALSAGAALIMMMVLLRAFGTRPLFDRAMQGDLAALLACLHGPFNIVMPLLWIGLGAVLLYSVVSSFLTAGLVAVLLDAPSRRREVVRWFGAAGASNFLPFLRLAAWSILPYAIVLGVAGFGLRMAGEVQDALGLLDLVRTVGLGLVPALALHWFLAAAIDYARIDLVRHPGLSSVRALMRGFRVVGRHPLALGHTLLYGLVFAGVTALYIGMTGGGAVSALAGLFVLRQGAGLLRFGAHVILIAGQVELACATMTAPLGTRP